MEEHLKAEVDALFDAVRDEAASLAPLWASWRSGNRSLAEIAQPLEAQIERIVTTAGELWPHIETLGEREQIAVRVIERALDLAGVNLPGPDQIYAVTAVKLAVMGWRYGRDVTR